MRTTLRGITKKALMVLPALAFLAVFSVADVSYVNAEPVSESTYISADAADYNVFAAKKGKGKGGKKRPMHDLSFRAIDYRICLRIFVI